MTQPRVKKSETLEIRLSYPAKLAFMARCRDEGRSASEALRLFIEGHIEPTKPARRTPQRLIAGALIAAAVGAFALPSLAHTNQRAAFDCLARDHAAISASDLARLDTNHDGKISFEEFRAAYGAAPHR